MPPDLTDLEWVDGPESGYSNGLRRFCESDGSLVGTLCFEVGDIYSCGANFSRSEGDTLSGSLSVPLGTSGVSTSVGFSHTVSESYGHTSGRCETCQMNFCRVNATVRHHRCICGSLWGTYDCSYTETDGTNNWRPSCVDDPSCGPHCRDVPPSTDDGGASGAGGEQPAGKKAVQSYQVELASFFGMIDGEAGGQGPSHPASCLDELNRWQQCEIQNQLDGTEAETGVSYDELVVFDADGRLHAFDLTETPDPFACHCPWDLDRDGTVGEADERLFDREVGSEDPANRADFDYDGFVGELDRRELLANTGACDGV